MKEIVQEQQASELAMTLMDQAKAVVVRDDASYEAAGAILVAVKEGIKDVKKYWEDPIKKQQAALDVLKDRKNLMLDPLIQTEVQLKIMIGDYRIKADKERAERERVARKALEDKARAEQQALAKEMESFGNVEAAAKVAVAPVVVPPVILQGAPKMDGVQFRDNWKAEVMDPMAIPREYLIPDEKKLSAVAKALKGDAKVPGVRFWCEKVVVAGR